MEIFYMRFVLILFRCDKKTNNRKKRWLILESARFIDGKIYNTKIKISSGFVGKFASYENGMH